MSVAVTACGPDTIFLRPGLDTPDRHIANGHALLKQGKPTDACREFRRASELAPRNVDALVGLALALGQSGEIDRGLSVLDRASELVQTDRQRVEVKKGYEELDQLAARPREKPVP